MSFNVSFKFENYGEFRNFIVNEDFSQFFPNEFKKSRVFITDYYEHNGKKSEVLAIVRPLMKNSKGFGMELSELYGLYKEKGFQGLIQHIINIVTAIDNGISNEESIREKVEIKIVNENDCDFDLSDMPHRKIFDLVLFYVIKTFETEKSYSYCYIRNNMIEEYGITEEELFNIAMKKANDEVVMKSPIEYMTFMMDSNSMLDKIMSEQFFKHLFTPIDDLGVIVTNEKQHYASVNIANHKLLRQIADKFNNDFFIAVRSKHDFICISRDSKLSANDVKMLIENSYDKTKIKSLSNNVYLYKREEDNLFIYTE